MLDKKITRRVFIGATAVVVSTPLFATIYNQKQQIEKVVKDGQFFNASELTTLTDVAEIMIPETDTPGATDAHVIPVLDALMMTWAGKNTKAQFRLCVQTIEKLAKDTFQKDYAQVGFTDRQTLLVELDKTAFTNKKSELSVAYRRLKEIIFHVFYTSEEANPDFVLIPGGYRGNLNKSELDTINARGHL